MSQNLTVPSKLEDTRVLPSGEITTSRTSRVCPVKERMV